MSSSIGRGVRRLLALLAAVGLLLSASPAAHAGKPVKPSAPINVAIGTVTMSGGSYIIPVTWQAGANTVSFTGTVTAGGVTLAAANLTTTSWSPSVTAKAGTLVTATITAVNGKQKASSSASKVLPDVTAPVGAYDASWGAISSGKVTATITQVSLTDDVTAAAGVQVVVDYGDGKTFSTNGSQTSVTHDYSIPDAQPHRFQPQIKLTDAAGNASYAAVNAIVVNDTTAPEGTATLARSSGWADWTPVSLTTTATDNVSPVDKVKRTITWGDGATSTAYGNGAVSHVYAAAGTYQPSVVFEDEARNPVNPNRSASYQAGTVTIQKDLRKPVASLTLPRKKLTSIRTWKTLKGSATDAETAVRSVRVKVVQKRGAAYYAYVPAKHAWVKAGRKARALARAGYLRVTTTSAWSVAVPKLTTGVLLYRVEAVDVMGNVSAVVQHRQRLTKR